MNRSISQRRALAALADYDDEEDISVMEIDPNGTTRWVMSGMDHRVGGPAIIRSDGETWCYEGLMHREDGPAVTFIPGNDEWWIHGDPINSYEELQTATGCSDEDIVALKLRWGAIIPCH